MVQKYRFIKDYKCQYGTIIANSEVQFMNHTVYINGGMLSQEWGKIIAKIIENDPNGNYVRPETPVIGEF